MGRAGVCAAFTARNKASSVFPPVSSEAKIAISRDEPGPLAGAVCGALLGLGLQCMLAASQPCGGPGGHRCSGLPSKGPGEVCVGQREAWGSNLCGHFPLPSFGMCRGGGMAMCCPQVLGFWGWRGICHGGHPLWWVCKLRDAVGRAEPSKRGLLTSTVVGQQLALMLQHPSIMWMCNQIYVHWGLFIWGSQSLRKNTVPGDACAEKRYHCLLQTHLVHPHLWAWKLCDRGRLAVQMWTGHPCSSQPHGTFLFGQRLCDFCSRGPCFAQALSSTAAESCR